MRSLVSQVKVQYNTVSNWVNLAKGGHSCQFCGRTYPWKAALDKHIEKQHKVQNLKFKLQIMIESACSKVFQMNKIFYCVIHYGELNVWEHSLGNVKKD